MEPQWFLAFFFILQNCTIFLNTCVYFSLGLTKTFSTYDSVCRLPSCLLNWLGIPGANPWQINIALLFLCRRCNLCSEDNAVPSFVCFWWMLALVHISACCSSAGFERAWTDVLILMWSAFLFRCYSETIWFINDFHFFELLSDLFCVGE